MRPSPVQQITIQPIGPEVSERSLARPPRSRPRGILRQHLGDQEHFIAPARDGFADQLARRRLRHTSPRYRYGSFPDRGRGARRRSWRRLLALVEVPGPLADGADLTMDRTEALPFDRRHHQYFHGRFAPLKRQRCGPERTDKGRRRALIAVNFAVGASRLRRRVVIALCANIRVSLVRAKIGISVAAALTTHAPVASREARMRAARVHKSWGDRRSPS